MLLPEVIGVSVKGSLKEGVTATDLVLTLTEILRNYGVVGKFVEFFGDGHRRRIQQIFQRRHNFSIFLSV